MTAAFLAQEGGGGGESSNFLLPNATIIVELIIFLVVFGLVWRYVVPPVKRSMDERQDMVRRQVEDSQEAGDRLEAADARYREALAEARTEAAKIRDDSRADAQRTREQLRAQADEEVARIRQRGEEQLATQRDQVVRELRSDVGPLAVSLAERIVGDSVADEDRRNATIDRFIDELQGAPAREIA